MSKLVDMETYRLEQTVERGFARWKKRFGGSYSGQTRLSDLGNNIIGVLADPGEESTTVYYELIMGVLNRGNPFRFEYLKPADRLQVVDTHLFLADNVRYEMMRRIEWIQTYPNIDRSLIDLIETYDQTDYSRYTNPPQLSGNHPQYASFHSRITREKEVMLRQLHLDALDHFKSRFES